MPSLSFHRSRTTWTAIFISSAGFAFGIALLAIANILNSHPNYQAILRALGGLFVATITLKTLWDLFAKRSFLAELMAMTQLAEDVRIAGILHVTSDFYRGFDWPGTFAKVHQFDLLFAYGRTWRGMNRVDLQRFAEKKQAKVRILLPNPNSPEVITELARRFSTTAETVQKEILEASRDFRKIFEKTSQFGLWYLPLAPVYGWYRFDQLAVVTFYKHGQERTNVPTFIVEQGGTVFDFMMSEFENLIAPGGKAEQSGEPAT